MQDDPDHLGPLAQSLLAAATVADLKADAADVAMMYRSLLPTPSLDAWPWLATDPHKRERQLTLLWRVENRFRRRLQDNLRRSLELLAG